MQEIVKEELQKGIDFIQKSLCTREAFEATYGLKSRAEFAEDHVIPQIAMGYEYYPGDAAVAASLVRSQGLLTKIVEDLAHPLLGEGVLSLRAHGSDKGFHSEEGLRQAIHNLTVNVMDHVSFIGGHDPEIAAQEKARTAKFLAEDRKKHPTFADRVVRTQGTGFAAGLGGASPAAAG